MEVDVERALHKLSKENPEIKNVEVKKAMDAGSVLIVVDKGNARKLIGTKGQTLKKIAEEMGSHTRIIEEPRSTRDLLNKLVKPSAVLGVNVLYTPEGETFRVRVDKSHKNQMPINPDSFPKVSKELLDKEMELVFE